VWARENGLVAGASVPALTRAAAADPDTASDVVTRAIRFRAALYSVLVGPAAAADWGVINGEVAAATAASSLARAGRPPGRSRISPVWTYRCWRWPGPRRAC